MGKKRVRKSITSKGQRRNIVAGVKEARRDKSPIEKALNKVAAWKKGLNPWIAVPGPDSKHAWIKKRANEVYGDFKNTANIYKGKNADE